VVANTTLTNSGTAKISTGVIDSTFIAATVTPAITLTYNSAANTLTGFPATLPVTVTNNGVATVFAAGTPVTYSDGATLSFGGASFTLTGKPSNGDNFTIAQNSNATTDNRNALLLANLQTKNTLQGGTASYQGVYSQLVSQVGNKTRELQVTSTAQTTLVNQSIQAQQSVSGVNLDEEAANLLRYQRAYQAAGKAMQIANTLFDTLIQLGR
jgi:flagellar hook-associated protein 1 FlgK